MMEVFPELVQAEWRISLKTMGMCVRTSQNRGATISIHLSTIYSIHSIHSIPLNSIQDAFETKPGLMSPEKDVVLTTVKTAILLVQTPAGKLY